ncbi:helix-turn-helix domain-containing protein [Virgibacillus dakarensis]|uniref:helix-turn-helix domain-containing protein n=1 Tax=Virgibacillus dakarensis TaxID=1917889 RepID=UPI000B44AD25|nr:helix-turn-helix domain-containing protein [Virgibacillus dakarensis]
MTGMIDANTKDNECGLLPYPIILAANKGDPEAMNYVILHYGSYMASLSMRKLYVSVKYYPPMIHELIMR